MQSMVMVRPFRPPCKRYELLEQPGPDHCEVAVHPFAVRNSGRSDRLVDPRFLLGYLVVPRHVDVAQCPGVLQEVIKEASPSGS